MKFLAIIPARGGSKRIPRKNIKNFAGQPIIKYSIDAAISSGLFDEIMVSTDDQEIAEVAKSLGASIPFFRSKTNSIDTATTIPVLEEVIAEYKKIGQEFGYVYCIYPTALFITGERLKLARKMIIDKNADAVIPVTKSSYPIQRALKIEDGIVKMFWPENAGVRSQDLEPSYFDCGQFYLFKVSSLLEQKTLYPRNSIPLIVPEHEAQDLDNEEDWKIAELKFNLLKEKQLK